jgi:hypothetical protein
MGHFSFSTWEPSVNTCKPSPILSGRGCSEIAPRVTGPLARPSAHRRCRGSDCLCQAESTLCRCVPTGARSPGTGWLFSPCIEWRFVVPNPEWIEHLLPSLQVLQVHIPSPKATIHSRGFCPYSRGNRSQLSAARDSLGPKNLNPSDGGLYIACNDTSTPVGCRRAQVGSNCLQ